MNFDVAVDKTVRQLKGFLQPFIGKRSRYKMIWEAGGVRTTKKTVDVIEIVQTKWEG